MKEVLIWIEAFLIACGLAIIFLLSLFEAALVASSKSLVMLNGAEGVMQVLLDRARSRLYISAFVVGYNIAILFVSALTTHLLVILAPGKTYIHAMGTLLMLIFILSFCEITPKAYSLQHPERIVRRWNRLLRLFGEVLIPVTSVFTTAAQFSFRAIGHMDAHEQLKLTSEEIMALLEISTEEDVLEKREFDIASKILQLSKASVKEVMVPRPDIAALPVNSKVDEVVKAIINSGHSRIPVYEGSIDNIVGVVYAYDILSQWSEGRFEFNLTEIMRASLYVPETKRLSELLNEMRVARVHIAIVVDEYGSTAGLVTLEDIVEQVVGELIDEHDIEAPKVQPLQDGSYIVDARLTRNELYEELGILLPEGSYETIGGFVLFVLGRIPKVGESIKIDGATIIVDEVRRRRVFKVRIVMHPKAERSKEEDVNEL